MDGWNKILSYWVSAYFQGLLLLVLGRVFKGISSFQGQPYKTPNPESLKKVWEWNYPPTQDASDHQDYEPFLIGDPNRSTFICDWNPGRG